jgi:putative DNA primase/helicase
MENSTLSFADELRAIKTRLDASKRPKSKRQEVAHPPTGFFIQDAFDDYTPADVEHVADKSREIFIQNGDDFIPWNGPRPEPEPKQGQVMVSAEQGVLPVSAVSDQFTDMRLAAVFTEMFRAELRYWPEVGKWLVFDGRRWTTDAPGGAFPYIRKMIEALYSRAAACTDYGQRSEMLKVILKLEEHQRQKTILEAAKVRPELIISSAELDQHHMLLTCSNGTIDLNYGTLRQHRADDFMTRMTAIDFNPDAKCPLFEKFLSQIFDGNENIIRYLQRFAGYCLTGRTDEQILLFFYGLGCNGKSVLANVLDALMGDYASTAGSDLLMSRDNRGSTNDIAALRGSRLVKVSEFDDGEKLAEAQIKTLTGGDPVSCRFLYCENFTYTPTYKILLIGNHKPKVRDNGHGIWRRLHLLPFDVTIPEEERDADLQDKLLRELPGILTWAVQGCLKWREIKLSKPDMSASSQ